MLGELLFAMDFARLTCNAGSFVYLYKFLFNALPFMSPPPHKLSSEPVFDENYSSESSMSHAGMSNIDVEGSSHATSQRPAYRERRAQRLSLSASAMKEYGMIRKRTRRWHAVVAGALAGGLAVMFEKRGRRLTIAQQLFVR
jgi:hypothetical protein